MEIQQDFEEFAGSPAPSEEEEEWQEQEEEATEQAKEIEYVEADFIDVEKMQLPPELPPPPSNYDFLTELAKKVSLLELDSKYLVDDKEPRRAIARFICDYIAPRRLLYDYASLPHPWYVFTQQGWKKNEKGQQAFIHALDLAYQFFLMKERAANLTVAKAIKKIKAAKSADEKKRAENEAKKFMSIRLKIHQLTAPHKTSHFSTKKTIDEILLYCLAGHNSGTKTKSISISGGWDDEAAYVVPVKNGLIDLQRGEFRRYTPSDLVLTHADVEFAPRARCPLFEKTLSEIFKGDRELISWLHKFMGYTLTRNPKLDKLVFFYGPTGRNGKSLLANTLLNVLGRGKLATQINSVTLLENAIQGRNAATPDVLEMRGRALCVISELNRGAKLNVAFLKAMTGGDMLTGRNLYSPVIQKFMPVHTFLILTNHRPSVDAMDTAFWKRVIVVPFSATYSETPGPGEYILDPDLEEKLKCEAAGILNWLIQGALDYMKNPRVLTELPAAVKAATEAYHEAQDTLKDFLDECCIFPDPDGSVGVTDFYKTFRQWCKVVQGQSKVAGKKTFIEQLAKKNITQKRTKNSRLYEGVSLLSDAELEEMLGDSQKWQ